MPTARSRSDQLRLSNVTSSLIDTLYDAWPQMWHEELGSTNDLAISTSKAGDLAPVWIATRSQTKGRGRRGRSWLDAKDNLFATARFVFPGAMQEATSLCFLAGLAVADTLAEISGGAVQPLLKWPNDVLVGGRKITGILIETGRLDDSASWIAAGIGVNLAGTPEGVSDTAISLTEAGGGVVAPEAALMVLDRHFRARLATLLTLGFEPLRHAWLERSAHKDGYIERETPSGLVQGRVVGLDDLGGLIVEGAGGARTTITAGEVHMVSEGSGHAAGH